MKIYSKKCFYILLTLFLFCLLSLIGGLFSRFCTHHSFEFSKVYFLRNIILIEKAERKLRSCSIVSQNDFSKILSYTAKTWFLSKHPALARDDMEKFIQIFPSWQTDSLSKKRMPENKLQKYPENIRNIWPAHFNTYLTSLNQEICAFENSEMLKNEYRINGFSLNNEENVVWNSPDNADLFFKEYDLYVDGFFLYILQKNSEYQVHSYFTDKLMAFILQSNDTLLTIADTIQEKKSRNIDYCMQAFESAIQDMPEYGMNPWNASFLYTAALLAKGFSVPDDFLKLFREHLVSMADNEGNQERQKEIWQELKNTVQSQY